MNHEDRMRVCILNGVHTPGSDWEKECPVLRARRRQEAAYDGAGGVVAGSAEEASRTRVNSGDSSEVSVTRRPPGPRRGGRPRKHATGRVAHAAAQRAYRQRERAAQAAANDALMAEAR
jgi:hypothetical protein